MVVPQLLPWVILTLYPYQAQPTSTLKSGLESSPSLWPQSLQMYARMDLCQELAGALLIVSLLPESRPTLRMGPVRSCQAP